MTQLETDRLILRGFCEEDAADMYGYASNPRVGPPAGWLPHASLEDSRRIVRMFIQEDDVWAIVDRASGRVIGSVGLHRDPKRSVERAKMIGYVLDEAYWGRGMALEAVRAVMRHGFADMHLETISAYHYPFNTRSKRVIEKSGMRYEGTLRRASSSFGGEPYDDVCYAITREEWEADGA